MTALLSLYTLILKSFRQGDSIVVAADLARDLLENVKARGYGGLPGRSSRFDGHATTVLWDDSRQLASPLQVTAVLSP